MVTFPNIQSRAGSLATPAGTVSSAPRLSASSGEPEDGFDLSGPRGALNITGRSQGAEVAGLRLSGALRAKHKSSMRILGNMPGGTPYAG